MNRDTYARFLRSDAYKELLVGGKKKVSSQRERLVPNLCSFGSNTCNNTKALLTVNNVGRVFDRVLCPSASVVVVVLMISIFFSFPKNTHLDSRRESVHIYHLLTYLLTHTV